MTATCVGPHCGAILIISAPLCNRCLDRLPQAISLALLAFYPHRSRKDCCEGEAYQHALELAFETLSAPPAIAPAGK